MKNILSLYKPPHLFGQCTKCGAKRLCQNRCGGKYLWCGIFILIAGIFFTAPCAAIAHGTGKSFEREIGDYFIDIGASVFEIRSEESVVFDFNLYEKTEQQAGVFTDIWIQVKHDNTAMLAGAIAKARLGETTLVYQFPEKGEYILVARFQNNGELIVETEFAVSVVDNNNDTPFFEGDIFRIIGIIVVSALVLILVVGSLLALSARPKK